MTGTPLYPAFAVPQTIARRQRQRVIQYPNSFLWDFEKGDFAQGADGRFVQCDGWTAWAQWCIKAVLTERFAYLAYPRSYGTELEGVPQLPTQAAAEVRVARTITEALMTDFRTGSVGKFTFAWQGDGCVVSFRIIPRIGAPFDVELNIG